MANFGSIKFLGGKWHLDLAPHVSVRLKRIFGKAASAGAGKIVLSDNDEVRHDLLWFMDRYPLLIAPDHEIRLRAGRATFLENQAKCEQILASDYKPKQYDLALPLRDYQSRAVDLYLSRRRLLCADDVGLGKTAVAVASFTETKTLPALVVTQTHLGHQWIAQIKKFLPNARVFLTRGRSLADLPLEDHDVYVTTYSRIIGWGWALDPTGGPLPDAHDQAVRTALSQGFFKSVVFDEMQELRRPSSEKYNIASIIAAKSAYTLGLSATPIYNYADEIFFVIDLLESGILGTYDEFQREWCGWDFGKSKNIVKDTAALRSFLKEKNVMLRRTRTDVRRELPPVEKQIIDVEFDADALESSIASSADLAARVLTGSFIERGMAARQLDAKLRLETGVAKAKQVAAFVKGLLECDERVLLVGWHRAVYDIYLKELAEFKPVMYTGSENSAAKEKSKDAFVKGDARVLIMSLGSGIGLDGLQEVCDIIVFGELDWSPGRMHQCIGRLARDGVKKGVVAFYLIANGGADPVMVDVLGLKSAQADGLMNEESGLGEAGQEVNIDRVKTLARMVIQKSGRELPAEAMTPTPPEERQTNKTPTPAAIDLLVDLAED